MQKRRLENIQSNFENFVCFTKVFLTALETFCRLFFLTDFSKDEQTGKDLLGIKDIYVFALARTIFNIDSLRHFENKFWKGSNPLYKKIFIWTSGLHNSEHIHPFHQLRSWKITIADVQLKLITNFGYRWGYHKTVLILRQSEVCELTTNLSSWTYTVHSYKKSVKSMSSDRSCSL